MTAGAPVPSRAALKQRACPICGRKVSADADGAYPFCSERCADVDLHRWLSVGNAPRRGLWRGEEAGDGADSDG